ncbi:dTDP-4-dehydrorhamnose reductase [Pseudopelagicola sp. nBUS_19]|uniref:dTDP-4-dehydrorhamnose reductase n=1 Tax=Pseudopelagicola sp. nBUS_19 TaxID=3395316 RepID=UPI003EBFED44
MILVFGKNGQLAKELAVLEGVTCVGREVADLSNPDACSTLIRALTPAAVINAAAYTAVDKAEDEEELATLINGTAPGAMAAVCAELAIPFIHVSTDYVFAGTGEAAWAPADPVAPQNAYGRSKLAGEVAVQKAAGAFAILRTSWVVSAHGNNFVKTMLRLGNERKKLRIVSDQIGAPTSARAIAVACLTIVDALIARTNKSGVYHFQSTPYTSWADFARMIFAEAGLSCEVEDIQSSLYPTPATRPLNSRLDCTTLKNIFGISRPDWHADVRDILKDLEVYP